MSVARYLRSNKEKQARHGYKNADKTKTSMKVQGFERRNDGESSGHSQGQDEVQHFANNIDNDLHSQEGDNNLDQTRDICLEDQENFNNAHMIRSYDDEIPINEGEDNNGTKKKKKTYKTNTPRGPTRNLQMAKMRPGEKKKSGF